MIKPKIIKNAGHKPFNDMVRKDWEEAIRQHPDRFEALMFAPKALTQSAVVDDAEEKPLFGTLNNHQETIEYQDPILVVAVEATSDDDAFLTMWDGEDSLGMGQSFLLTLRIAPETAEQDIEIPEGTIVNFIEEDAEGNERQAWWYINRSDTYGTASVGVLHYCIPCGDLEMSSLPVEQ